MKKTLLLLALLACLFVPSFALQQEVIEVPLHTELPDNGMPRGGVSIPITCYAISNLNELLLVSNVLSETVHVYVENPTTGYSASECVALNSFPSPISLFGQGDYLIEITLSSGAVYYGSFEL